MLVIARSCWIYPPKCSKDFAVFTALLAFGIGMHLYQHIIIIIIIIVGLLLFLHVQLWQPLFHHTVYINPKTHSIQAWHHWPDHLARWSNDRVRLEPWAVIALLTLWWNRRSTASWNEVSNIPQWLDIAQRVMCYRYCRQICPKQNVKSKFILKTCHPHSSKRALINELNCQQRVFLCYVLPLLSSCTVNNVNETVCLK